MQTLRIWLLWYIYTTRGNNETQQKIVLFPMKILRTLFQPLVVFMENGLLHKNNLDENVICILLYLVIFKSSARIYVRGARLLGILVGKLNELRTIFSFV